MTQYYYTIVQNIESFEHCSRRKFQDSNTPYILIKMNVMPTTLLAKYTLKSHHLTFPKKTILINGIKTDFHHTLILKSLDDNSLYQIHVHYNQNDDSPIPKVFIEGECHKIINLSKDETHQIISFSLLSSNPLIEKIKNKNEIIVDRYQDEYNQLMQKLSCLDVLNGQQDCLTVIQHLKQATRALEGLKTVTAKNLDTLISSLKMMTKSFSEYRQISISNPIKDEIEKQPTLAEQKSDEPAQLNTQKKKKKKKKKKKISTQVVHTTELSLVDKQKINSQLLQISKEIQTHIHDIQQRKLIRTFYLTKLSNIYNLLNDSRPLRVFFDELSICQLFRSFDLFFFTHIHQFYQQWKINAIEDIPQTHEEFDFLIKLNHEFKPSINFNGIHEVIKIDDAELLLKIIKATSLKDTVYTYGDSAHILTDWCIKHNAIKCFRKLIIAGFSPYPRNNIHSCLMDLQKNEYQKYCVYNELIIRCSSSSQLDKTNTLHQLIHLSRSEKYDGIESLKYQVSLRYFNTIQSFKLAIKRKTSNPNLIDALFKSLSLNMVESKNTHESSIDLHQRKNSVQKSSALCKSKMLQIKKIELLTKITDHLTRNDFHSLRLLCKPNVISNLQKLNDKKFQTEIKSAFNLDPSINFIDIMKTHSDKIFEKMMINGINQLEVLLSLIKDKRVKQLSYTDQGFRPQFISAGSASTYTLKLSKLEDSLEKQLESIFKTKTSIDDKIQETTSMKKIM